MLSDEMHKDLYAQTEKEAAEIAAAPKIYSGALNLRCHFCGQLTDGGSELRGPIGNDGQPQIRFKGVCCGG